MQLSRLAKAAFLGFGYYLLLNVYLYLALAFEKAPAGIMANKVIAALVYGSGFILTLPFVYFVYKFGLTTLASISLILNALFWTLLFYLILWFKERREKA